MSDAPGAWEDQPGREARPLAGEAEAAVTEAVFRHLLRPRRDGTACFLSVGAAEDHDPDDAFMERFTGYQPPVRPVSEATRAGTSPPGPASSPAAFPGQVIDRRTGQPGLILRVHRLTWLGESEARVEASTFAHGLAARGWLYHIVREGDRWVIDEVVLDWIA
jgi:hypothetical protein